VCRMKSFARAGKLNVRSNMFRRLRFDILGDAISYLELLF
jgi:hypothetical protein